MTSFRNIVIGTNLVTVGLGGLLVIIVPEGSIVSALGKILVIAGIFGDVILAFAVTSLPTSRGM
jgi:hypothetical protein